TAMPTPLNGPGRTRRCVSGLRNMLREFSAGFRAGDTSKVTLFGSVAQAEAGLPSTSIEYTYDSLGRVFGVEDPRYGVETLTYDAHNQVTQVVRPQGTLSYTYDPLGRITDTATVYTHTHYTRDVLGRLASVTVDKLNGLDLAAPMVTTYQYTPTGN